MQKNRRCKCEYCLKFIEEADRDIVKPGEQCKAGFRWDLTGEIDDAKNVGRDEFFQLSIDSTVLQVRKYNV